MSKQGKKALERKLAMEEKIKKMEEKVKQYEERAERELGKYIIKQWGVKDTDDSETLFEIIDLLKDDAKKLLKDKSGGMGKSEE